MKAVAYQQSGAIDRDDALHDIKLETPKASGRDLLVKVHAVSVNPIDTKLRTRRNPAKGQWAILGFDASGVVAACGPEVEGFAVGDAVFYAGALNRQGSNSEYQLVDERLVGYKPQSINHAEAAALPLTAITAWEMLFDRLDIRRPTAEGGQCILIIGGAGGVGSICIQLLRALTDMTIIATASRPTTEQWVKQCGAHHVINHHQALAPQIQALGLDQPGFVFSTTHSEKHYTDIVELIAPQGRFGLIDDPGDLSIAALKTKAISLHWELMFTRSSFNTADVAEQGAILNQVAKLIDNGKIKTTLKQILGKIDAQTLRQAHAQIEAGKVHGKIVLEGF